LKGGFAMYKACWSSMYENIISELSLSIYTDEIDTFVHWLDPLFLNYQYEILVKYIYIIFEELVK